MLKRELKPINVEQQVSEYCEPIDLKVLSVSSEIPGTRVKSEKVLVVDFQMNCPGCKQGISGRFEQEV